MWKVVLDTNILVSALLSPDGACRAVLRMAFEGRIEPLIGHKLFLEYQSVLGREHIFARGPFDAEKRSQFLDDYASMCRWVEIHFNWRPNLRDEADNHVIELALAGQARFVVTHNIRDFATGELNMPDLRIVDAGTFLATERSERWRH